MSADALMTSLLMAVLPVATHPTDETIRRWQCFARFSPLVGDVTLRLLHSLQL